MSECGLFQNLSYANKDCRYPIPHPHEKYEVENRGTLCGKKLRGRRPQ